MDSNGQCTRVWSVDFKTCGKNRNDISMDTPSEVSALIPPGDTPSSVSSLPRRLREAEIKLWADTLGVSAGFCWADTSVQVWPMSPAWMCLLPSVHGNKDLFCSKDTHTYGYIHTCTYDKSMGFLLDKILVFKPGLTLFTRPSPSSSESPTTLKHFSSKDSIWTCTYLCLSLCIFIYVSLCLSPYKYIWVGWSAYCQLFSWCAPPTETEEINS